MTPPDRGAPAAVRPRHRTTPCAPSSPSTTPSGPRPLYLGTYTSVDGGGEGIGLASYDPATGRISGAGVIGGVGDPSFLAVHPDGRTLYLATADSYDPATTAETHAGRISAVRVPVSGH